MNAFPDEMQAKIAKKLEAEAKEKEKESGSVKAGGKKAKQEVELQGIFGCSLGGVSMLRSHHGREWMNH